MSAPRTRFVAGCMTGTSLDGLDVALAGIEGSGLEMRVTLRGHLSMPLGGVAKDLRRFAEGQAAPPIDYLRAARALGELHANAVAELVRQFLPARRKLDFVVAHGQTIWHAPRDSADMTCDSGHRVGDGLSWQLLDPWPLVRVLNSPVCYDLRQADLIAGGQGAPITPLADWVLYRDRATRVVNLGGICNITTLDRDPQLVRGRDLWPCNLMLDGLCFRLFGKPFDEDGRLAAKGTSEQSICDVIFHQVKEAIGSHESLGREQFPAKWLDLFAAVLLQRTDPLTAIRSAVAVVAEMIVDSGPGTGRDNVMVLAGGGARNGTLVHDICVRAASIGAAATLSDAVGIPVEAREALAFAVLGALSQDGVPITLPRVTGAEKPGRAGAWVYP